MSRLMVDTGASKYFINNNLTPILRELDSEISNLVSLKSRLSSLNRYYSRNDNIISNLNSALNEVRYDYDALERFIRKYKLLIDEIERVDKNLAAKFKKEVKEYCKSNAIETTEWYDKALDYLQIALDVVGFIPLFGEVADLANALVSALRGNWVEAGICLVAMIPLVGDSFKALKYTDEAADLLKYGDEVVDMGAAVLKQGSKNASKKASKEFTEKAIKDPDAAKDLLHKTMDIGNGDFYIKNTYGADFKLDLNNNDIPIGVKDSIVAGCFLGETKVKTEDGFVAIKDMEEGNKVLTVNEETGQEEYKEVKKVFIRSGNEICIIKAGNDIIKATTGHLFKVKDKWWTAAINIEKGDYICTDDNKYLQVEDISVEKNNYPSFVYNLSVDENHNYFVGEEKILAHNMANMKSCSQGVDGVSNISDKLIPGTSGVVTGGSSTKLGKNLFESMGISTNTKRTPYQAMHIIPKEFKSHPVIKKIGMDFDDASNGIFLKNRKSGGISPMSRHEGNHKAFNDFVEGKLDSMDINKTIPELENELYNIQQKVKKLMQEGLPMYAKENERIDKWGDIIRGLRGENYGDYTVDLWERWFNK